MPDKIYDSATVTEGKIEREIMHNDVVLIEVSIKYPIISGVPASVQKRINNYYTYVANKLLNHCEKTLYKFALDAYNAMSAGIPFSVTMTYEITKNAGGVLSLFSDVYEYMGGAHGNTTRYGDTWSLRNGYPIAISSLFPKKAKYKKMIIAFVIQQAEDNLQHGGDIYYADFRPLIQKKYSEDNFYLTEDGLAIFYQQYDIAPYVAGIIVFVMPYDEENGPFPSPYQ